LFHSAVNPRTSPLFDRFAGRAGLFFGYPTLARA
jgi:hypothetical protein